MAWLRVRRRSKKSSETSVSRLIPFKFGITNYYHCACSSKRHQNLTTKEQEKKRQYAYRVLEIKKGTFKVDYQNMKKWF